MLDNCKIMDISNIVKIMLKVISNYLCCLSESLCIWKLLKNIMYYGIYGNIMLVSTLILFIFVKFIMSSCIIILF
jgi:hypothetical protein